MINLFCQNLNNIYFDKAKNFFKNDIWVNGKIVNNFEKNFEKKFKLNLKAVGCNSGSDALLIALLLDKNKKRDIYLTTPLSYIASSSIAKFLNLNLIYLDIYKDNYLLDLENLEIFLKNCPKKIFKRIKGIINVELFGATNDLIRMRKIAKKYNLSLIGDCSQSIGSKFRGQSSINYYDYAVTSFYPTKLLSAYGDGGMICVKKSLKQKALLLKNNGHAIYNKDDCKILGINSRLDSFQAYILDKKLNDLNKILRRKNLFYNILRSNLPEEFKLPVFNRDLSSNNYIFSFYIKNSMTKKFLNYMKNNKIECKIIYKKLLSENKVLKPIMKTKLINSYKIKKNLVSIPSHEKLSLKQFMYVIKKIQKFNS